MANEIRRNNWSRFLRKINADHRFRAATVTVRKRRSRPVELDREAPFLGLAITKSGRLIDGVNIYTGRWDPDQITEPAAAVKQPSRILQEKATDGSLRRLSVESKDGSMVTIDLTGRPCPVEPDGLVEKLAYAMYERRGASHGCDVDDWLEAERCLRELETRVTG